FDELYGEEWETLRSETRRAAATAASFALSLRPPGAARVLHVRGGPSPPGWRDGATLLWFIDMTESEEASAALRARVDRLAGALDALSGLIEGAPFPMWHRGPDLRLAMVNSAYVAAVEGESAEAVVR